MNKIKLEDLVDEIDNLSSVSQAYLNKDNSISIITRWRRTPRQVNNDYQSVSSWFKNNIENKYRLVYKEDVYRDEGDEMAAELLVYFSSLKKDSIQTFDPHQLNNDEYFLGFVLKSQSGGYNVQPICDLGFYLNDWADILEGNIDVVFEGKKIFINGTKYYVVFDNEIDGYDDSEFNNLEEALSYYEDLMQRHKLTDSLTHTHEKIKDVSPFGEYKQKALNKNYYLYLYLDKEDDRGEYYRMSIENSFEDAFIFPKLYSEKNINEALKDFDYWYNYLTEENKMGFMKNKITRMFDNVDYFFKSFNLEISQDKEKYYIVKGKTIDLLDATTELSNANFNDIFMEKIYE